MLSKVSVGRITPHLVLQVPRKAPVHAAQFSSSKPFNPQSGITWKSISPQINRLNSIMEGVKVSHMKIGRMQVIVVRRYSSTNDEKNKKKEDKSTRNPNAMPRLQSPGAEDSEIAKIIKHNKILSVLALLLLMLNVVMFVLYLSDDLGAVRTLLDPYLHTRSPYFELEGFFYNNLLSCEQNFKYENKDLKVTIIPLFEIADKTFLEKVAERIASTQGSNVEVFMDLPLSLFGFRAVLTDSQVQSFKRFGMAPVSQLVSLLNKQNVQLQFHKTQDPPLRLVQEQPLLREVLMNPQKISKLSPQDLAQFKAQYRNLQELLDIKQIQDILKELEKLKKEGGSKHIVVPMVWNGDKMEDFTDAIINLGFTAYPVTVKGVRKVCSFSGFVKHRLNEYLGRSH